MGVELKKVIGVWKKGCGWVRLRFGRKGVGVVLGKGVGGSFGER